jgi:hypothetical protein
MIQKRQVTPGAAAASKNQEEEKKGEDTTPTTPVDLIQTLNDDEKLALKLEADKKKVDKSVLKIVR